ncbi:Lipase (class 2) [Parelaphostrongylus tenuis]|uniref:Lipase (Class 2) n=1 Tax=Parelaphostrongylus tenuis TaxID=148309 RepID=A0AAD5MZ24_PARTN|nr:Lipase (class 2) [Parelaphostrongylus tenuis]
MLPTLTLFGAILALVDADFSSSFNTFLTNTYGKDFADRMARRDLGPDGSFGGGDHVGGTRTSREPVLLVHGIANTAGVLNEQRQHLLTVGWKDSEVYGTTYGDGGQTSLVFFDMKCDHIKQIRWMIQAVSAYTQNRVDVIGYSLGSPVARKAILGGRCVETGEELGPSLTAYVDTFVSVAGANRGSFLCVLPFPGACNNVNGLACSSRFIQDINSRTRYEGSYIFTIYTLQDERTGLFNACGQLAPTITGANQEFQRPGNHEQVMTDTIQLQANLISLHHAGGQ